MLPGVSDPSPSASPPRFEIRDIEASLGAPGWPKGSGAILSGLGMDSGAPDIIRAGIESMAFEAYDLVQAMPDLASTAALSVDGGGAGNNYLCQLLADLAQKTIIRPPSRESSLFSGVF